MNHSPWNLIWIDLEMTGLDPEHDRIIEVATLVTDSNLDVIAEGPIFAVSQDPALLDAMDEWNTRQHARSGLIERVRTKGVSEDYAETETVRFLQRHVPPQTSPMCGNSICQDRRFLARWMPRLEEYFHYRQIDVSSLKELARRWAPEVADSVRKHGNHLAMDDIKDSIEELRHYRRHFLRLPA